MEDSQQLVGMNAPGQPEVRDAGADPSPQGGADDQLAPVRLVGYPREPEPRGARRLYEHPDSKTYVEIKIEDIVDAPPIRDEDVQPGQIVIWVQSDTKVLLFEFPVLAVGDKRWPR